MIKKPPRTFASKCPSCGIFCQSHVSFRKQFCVCLFFLSKYELLFFRLSTSDDSCRHRPERQNVFSTMKMDSPHFLTSVKTTDYFALYHMTVCHLYVIILKIFFTPIHWLYFSNCVHARTPASISSSISFRRFSKTKFPQCKRMVELVRAKYLPP